MAEWQTKSGVLGTKKADFFLHCLDPAFADCLARDRKREIMVVIIYIAMPGLAKLDSNSPVRGHLDSKYSAIC